MNKVKAKTPWVVRYRNGWEIWLHRADLALDEYQHIGTRLDLSTALAQITYWSKHNRLVRKALAYQPIPF